MIELLPVESGAKLMVLFGTTKVLLRLNIILDRLRVVFLLILYALSRCYAKKTNNSPLFVLVEVRVGGSPVPSPFCLNKCEGM